MLLQTSRYFDTRHCRVASSLDYYLEDEVAKLPLFCHCRYLDRRSSRWGDGEDTTWQSLVLQSDGVDTLLFRRQNMDPSLCMMEVSNMNVHLLMLLPFVVVVVAVAVADGVDIRVMLMVVIVRQIEAAVDSV
jgi:hypothetical protein